MATRILKTRRIIHDIRDANKNLDNTYDNIYSILIYKWKKVLLLFIQSVHKLLLSICECSSKNW